ncbi:single-stranded-DNA-specific exonuclease RecJ [Hydrogenophaga sp. 2FB]|uniref:single-stranded-DNA-specific exonuclease RecJ n=1 Tax=Hydrogenophaga sp. 2FB TaxID=2502187 RepID=UPI0014852F0A|nr:single-stranded-DNA-specific exonuclease RecJ [Hydrogenophaga sp. 2FB]
MKTEIALEQRPFNDRHVERLKGAGMNPLIAKLYAARGVSTPSDAMGGIESLLPASSMKNVTAMANYLADCVVQRKRVLIISDYDCDGATACAVLCMAFGASGMNYDYLVPDRAIHGYGLTPAIVEEAAALEIKPDVIITVDNGISSTGGVARANELGIEVLVTDHHLAPEVLPDAKLIVNPNQPGCDFPSKDIAGCGVAWYVAKAMVQELVNRDMDPGFDPDELLSYVAIGTVADVVKLDRNNRNMVRAGLNMIRRGHCAPGVLALTRVANKFIGTLSTSDIGFGIGPRINAAGRLDHMKAGIELLTTLDEVEAQTLAKRLDKTNEERKDIQMDIVDEAVLQVKADLSDAGEAGETLFSILAYDPEWHEGVVGIVAGRIKEDRHRPTIVMCDASDGDIKGSGRSIPGFHLKHALDRINIEHPGILKKFGGHAMAAGMTIDRARLDEFKEALERVCRDEIAPELLIKRLRHDGEFPAEAFTVEDVRMLSMEVWGQGFEEPVFVNEIDVTGVKLIGELKNHLKLDGALHGQTATVLGFGLGDLAECVPEKISIAFKPQVNNFRGESTLQLLIDHVPESLNPGLDEILAENEEIKTQQELVRVARMRQEKLALNPSQDPVKITVATPDFDVKGALEAKAKNLADAQAQSRDQVRVEGSGAQGGAAAGDQVASARGGDGDGAVAPGQNPDQAGEKRVLVRRGLAETVALAAAASDGVSAVAAPAMAPVAPAAREAGTLSANDGASGPADVSEAGAAVGEASATLVSPAPLPARRYIPRARRLA